MKDGFIKVAAATPTIKVADPKYNTNEIIKCIREAAQNNAKVIILPELCLTGYTCNDLFLHKLLLDEARNGLIEIKKNTLDIDALIMVGLPIEHLGHLYNVSAVLCRGHILGMVPKVNIPTYGEFYEGRYFTSGREAAEEFFLDGESFPFESGLLFKCKSIDELVVGCEICEDLWVCDTPATKLALSGASIIANLSASNETVGKSDYRRMLVRATSARLICGYIYASAGEGESTQDLVFGGHNLIAENGSIINEAKRFENGIIYGDVDIQRLSLERRRMGTFGNKSNLQRSEVFFDLNVEETKLNRVFNKMPFVPDSLEERSKRCEEILSIQSQGLKKRYEHIGTKTAVIGVSGGLDSTLALLVIQRAFDSLGLDRKGIIAVTMPCFGTTGRTYQNACKLAKTLGATLMEVDIKEAVRIHFRDIGQDEEKKDVTYENCQARERTQVLMDIANKCNGLVIGTGDMSELALGWATYNGDHMSMYGVNAGVPKTLVRHLVKYYADTCENEELSKTLIDILDTPVSPELLPPVDGNIAQKTEDLVGPYELHDFFLYYMLRYGFPPQKIYRLAKLSFTGVYSDEIILKWLKTFSKRFFAQQFKRSCLPDGPKVGSVAVSPRGDLRMPSDASAKIWLEELEKLN